MMQPIIEIGYDKDGEEDFSVSAKIGELSLEQMNKLRAMISVAIGTAEGMFRKSIENQNHPGIKIESIYRTDLPPGNYPL